MLIGADTLTRIAAGEVDLAFRRWRRPTVRTGGTLLTSAGQLQIGAVTSVDAETITTADARRAGYVSTGDLLAELNRRPAGDVYRVEILGLRRDPRIALRQSLPEPGEVEQIRLRLGRLDAASPVGPWTTRTLRAIRAHPGLRAAELCRLVGQERARFKTNVRKLKALGLTMSLEAGYRLSPRGEAYLEAVASRATQSEASDT